MNDILPVYLVDFNPEDKRGVFAYALVENPAIEQNAVYLSKENENIILLKETEKGELITPVLIPNKKIIRSNSKGEKYYIQFSVETINKIQQHFHIDGNQSKANLEHTSLKLDGVTIVESWLKEFEQDKSTNYGFDLPVGTWFVKMKVNNEFVKEQLKSGAIKGISIEGDFDPINKKNNINNNQKMSKENEFLKSLKALFSKEDVVELADEPVVEVPEVETKLATLEVGSAVPDGTFTAEDGTVFTVVGGKISEVVIPDAPKEDEMPEVDMTAELAKIKEELKLSFDAQLETIKKEFHEKEVATIELKAQTKANPNFEIKEPKTFKQQIFNELLNK